MIVFLEANIGSGKSTCCEFLAAEFEVFMEPVDMWGAHLHGMYGPESARWALPMQMLALTTRHELLLRARDAAALSGRPVVVERSPRSDSIFAQDLTGDDMAAYRTVRSRYDELLADLDVRHVYLRASPETSMDRVKARGRPQERSMTLERSREMHRRHELEFGGDPTVVTIDADRTRDPVFTDVLRLVRAVGFQAV